MEIYTVGKLNAILKNYVESNEFFRFICVEGEVSNIKYQIKHMYMTLKDNMGSIRCAAFNYGYNEIPRNLKEGDKVKVYGSINIYALDASIQIVTRRIEKTDIIGDLYQKLELLKKEYRQKGYFDETLKKSLPKVPRRIGVVTSDTGDAIRDIIKNTHNRDKNVMIYLYPAKVQGKDASKSIAKGIEFFNAHDELKIECLIIGRGGGSIEDLWAFNEREVIEAIHNSDIPIISAVGHEADNLLSDLVADMRASTPTHAPHCVVKNRCDIDSYLNYQSNKLSKLLMQKVEIMKTKLENLKTNYYLAKFYENTILQKYQMIDDKKIELNRVIKSNLDISTKKEKLLYITKNINDLVERKLDDRKNSLKNIALNLKTYSIDNILDRGFSITTFNGKLIKDENIQKGDVINTKYKNGVIISEVK